METFGERLGRLMGETGLTYENLALLLDVSTQKIENLVTEYHGPDDRMLARLARIFNVSEAYIACMSDDPMIKEGEFAKEVYVAKCLEDVDGIVMQRDITGTIFLNREEVHGKEFFGYNVKDDSMVKARMLPGDLLVVCRQNYADNGDVVIAKVDDGDEIVRRYNRVGNIVTLTPEGDTMKYKVIKIDTTETKLHILGKVDQVRINEI